MTPRAKANRRSTAGSQPCCPLSTGSVAWCRSATQPPAQPVRREVTLRQLGLQPADLLAIVRDDQRPGMTELDDRIVRIAVANFAPRPDVAVDDPLHGDASGADSACSSVLPLVRQLRTLTTKSRPLQRHRPDADERSEGRAGHAAVRRQAARSMLVRAAMQNAARRSGGVPGRSSKGRSPIWRNRRGEILADVDDYVADLGRRCWRAPRRSPSCRPAGGSPTTSNGGPSAPSCAQAAASRDAMGRQAWPSSTRSSPCRRDAAATDAGNVRASRPGRTRHLDRSRTDAVARDSGALRADLTGVKRPAFDARRDQFDAVPQHHAHRGRRCCSPTSPRCCPSRDFDIAEFTFTRPRGRDGAFRRGRAQRRRRAVARRARPAARSVAGPVRRYDDAAVARRSVARSRRRPRRSSARISGSSPSLRSPRRRATSSTMR